MTSSTVSIIPTNENYNEALTWGSGASFSFSDLASVSDSDVSNLKALVGNLWDMREIDFSLIESFVYDGFDYNTLFKSLHLLKVRGKVADPVWKDTISKALAIHQLTGNITSKRYNSLAGPGKEMVNTTIKLLNIKIGKKSGLARSELTFPRMGALFPFQLSVIANKFPKDFASKYGTTELPSFMKTSSFPSLVPVATKYTDLLLTAYKAYSVDMTVALKGKDISTIKAEELTSIIESQSRFTKLSNDSGVLDNTMRIRAMRALRVDNEEVYNKLSKVASNFGFAAPLTFPEWTALLSSSYATIHDATGKALLPLPGRALEPIGLSKKEEEERAKAEEEARRKREREERGKDEAPAPSTPKSDAGGPSSF